MADGTLFVEVVCAEGRVWEGEALSVIARTTEGDIGILPRHWPTLSVLVPCAAEILTATSEREILAVDGGFISVSDNRVSILSPYAQLAKSISLPEAEAELARAQAALNQGDIDDETRRHFNRALAQVLAAQKAGGRR